MTTQGKLALAVGLLVMLATVLYPPWSYSTWGVGRRPARPPGFAYIPEVEIVRTMYAPLWRPPTLWKTHLNRRRLCVQLGVVAVVTTVLVVRETVFELAIGGGEDSLA